MLLEEPQFLFQGTFPPKTIGSMNYFTIFAKLV
jgi:hypothetical protein